MTPAIVFYVSGHGFGHASRDIELIGALRAHRPDLRIVVRTTASRWLFDLTLGSPVEFQEVECDTGVVQRDSLRLDPVETMRRAEAFYRTFPARVAHEAHALEATEAALVLTDMPPLGCAAATAAGIPAIAVGNFTWDWIYESYAEHLAPRSALLATMRHAYSGTSLALRLPMWGGFGAMPSGSIVDLPLIARRSRLSRAESRRGLGLPDDRRLALVSFGGYGVNQLNLDRIEIPGWTLVTSGPPGVREPAPHAGVSRIVLDETAVYRSGFRYEDLVAACDVVVTKPGYGIIAECAANRTAILYTSRGDFAEYDVLVREMPRMVRSCFFPQDDLFAGRWQPYLDALLAQPEPSPLPATSGAEVAAEIVLARLHGTDEGGS
jgi:hypothetical protein